LQCFCEQKETFDIKVEGDVDTDPIWCAQKDAYTALVSRVSKDVKDKIFRKNIGAVIQLAYSYSREFEYTMGLEYEWCYYFDQNKSIFDLEMYDFSDLERTSLLNGTILKPF
jgi:hypothetical protein